jgi:hypothetical protein
MDDPDATQTADQLEESVSPREAVRVIHPDAFAFWAGNHYAVRLGPNKPIGGTGRMVCEAWQDALNRLPTIPEPKPEPDATQVGGTHYRDLGIQPWDVLPHWLGREGFQAFLAGNVIKYLARYPRKGGLQDLEKARHYLDKLIAVMEADAEQG